MNRRTFGDLRSSAVTRRQMLGGAAGAAAGLALARTGFAQESTTATPAGGEWTFTDDKGVTVTLDSPPERLVIDVNAAAPLWDFGVRPVAVFGWNATESGDFGDAGGNIDPSTVEIVGNTSEPIQPEKVVAANPDLIITITWAPDDPEDYWSIAPDILPQVEPIAPIIALSATGSADVNTERFAELAAALGADLSSPEIVAQKERYDAALEKFPTIAEEKSDLSTVFMYIAPEEIYVANPPIWADLNLYASLGLNIVEPDAAEGEYWEQLSLEQALKYPSDVLFQSSRPGNLSLDELKEHPTFGQHPAIQAGQVFPWNQDFIMSYRGMADALESIMNPVSESTDATE